MIHFLTIVLDGMPYIPVHLPTLNRLKIPWRWHIVEGVAKNVKDTAWCQSILPRLSSDGTTQYLDSIASHPNVKIYRRPLWDGGKVEMVNTPLVNMKEVGLLWQLDADELWQPWQIEQVNSLFQMFPTKNCARFACRYFLGQNIVITSRGMYGNKPNEWLRVWRYEPGMKFEKHEPPTISGLTEDGFTQAETEAMGLVFDHAAYATEKQVKLKEEYYGYKGAVDQWKKLQANTKWPVRVGDYLQWVKDGATADLLIK